MTILPIAERELRVAARKRSTFWVRIIAALVALVIGSAVMLLFSVNAGFGNVTSLGKILFGTLTWLSLAAALSAGLFFTSDCLSEEKRDGTIGFLFLTDLKGYDVVLGKLLATSLRGLYALLATVPVLAVTLLMGGVAGEQFWKTSLALLSALFYSLAAGMLVSTFSRDGQKALMATMLLLLLLVGGGPAVDGLVASIQSRNFEPVLSLLSPVYVFVTAGAGGQPTFWLGFACNQAIAWGLLGLTCSILPRTWHQKPDKPMSGSTQSWARWWKFGGARRRAESRRILSESHPVVWLVCRERWQRVSLWLMSLLLAGGLAVIIASDEQSLWWRVWSAVGGLLMLLVYLGTATQAVRFFCESKRNGLLELLLATPCTEKEIVQGQWRAFKRMFGPAVTVCLAAQFMGAFLAQMNTWNMMAAAAPAAPAAARTTNAMGVATSSTTRVSVTVAGAGAAAVAGESLTWDNYAVALAISLVTTLTVLTNLVALLWFGMWMGLNSKSTNLASLKTIVFVQIIPWFGITFLSGLLIPLLMFSGAFRFVSGSSPRSMLYYPLIMSGLFAGLSLIKNCLFFSWSRKRLYTQFRDRAAWNESVPGPTRPPPLPASRPLTKLVQNS